MSNSHPPSSSAVKHGFTGSSFVVVRFEDLKEVANLKADLVACYKPVNSQELLALERMALCQQQILRGARLEAGLFTSALDEVLDRSGDPIRPMSVDLAGDGDIEITRAQNRNFGAGEGFRRLAKESSNWALLIRFQTHAERQYRRALEEFDRLKKLRPELPNERNIGTAPDAPEDLLMELSTEPKPWPPRAPWPDPPPAASESKSDISAAQPAPNANEGEPVSLSQNLLPFVAGLLVLLKRSLPSQHIAQNTGASSTDRRIPRRHTRRRPAGSVEGAEHVHSKRKLHSVRHMEISDQ